MTDETIVGLDVSALDAERLMIKYIRNDWVAIELPLAHSKWFDYRFMNPVASTYLYAHEFTKAYKRAYQRNIDTVRGAFVRPLPDDLFGWEKPTPQQKALVAGVWRGRQVADAMGMPYDIYLERAYYWVLRYWKQRHLPRPSHIYSDLAVDRAAIDWLELQRSRLYFSKRPEYQTAAYDSRIKALTDHHEWLFEQAELRGNSSDILAYMIDEDIMPIETIAARFEGEKLQEVLALTARKPQQTLYN